MWHDIEYIIRKMDEMTLTGCVALQTFLSRYLGASAAGCIRDLAYIRNFTGTCSYQVSLVSALNHSLAVKVNGFIVQCPLGWMIFDDCNQNIHVIGMKVASNVYE